MLFLPRAQETFTTTGTGTLTVGGAPTGWQTVAAALLAAYGLSGSVSRVAYYAVNEAETIWEFGYGTFDTAAGTWTRTLQASSTGALINWAAGTKYIFSTPDAIIHTNHLTHFRGPTAPAHARAGYTWLDTTAGVTDVRFKVYDGADWISLLSIDETNNRRYALDGSGAKMGGPQADVASAATANIGAAASDRVRITGTTTITAFDAVAEGVRRKVRFADTLTLTHNAASLILPSGQNITTAADDEAELISLGSGNWKCERYDRADGQAVAGVISPAQLAANTDNYNPTGLNLATVLRLSTDASRNLTGIVAPVPARVKEMILLNVGAQDLVLVHDATSTAANRFLCPSSTNYTVKTNAAARLVYDPTSARWRVSEAAATSPGTTITAGTPLVVDPYVNSTVTTQAHGLAAVPKHINATAECKTAEHGYSIGDKIDLTGSFLDSTGRGFGVFKDATNLILMTSTQMGYTNKSTAALVTLTSANWKLTLTPYNWT